MSAIKTYLTRRELADFLTDRDFPISKSTLDKLAMSSRKEGPPHAGFWGNRALYDPEKALAWAKNRFRKNWRQTFMPRSINRRRAHL